MKTIKQIALLGTVSILLSLGAVYAAESYIPTRVFTVDTNAWYKIEKFVDPDNGNVCYIIQGRIDNYISCVKP